MVGEVNDIAIKFTPKPYLPSQGRLIIENVHLDQGSGDCSSEIGYTDSTTETLGFSCSYDALQDVVTLTSALNSNYNQLIDLTLGNVRYANELKGKTYEIKVAGPTDQFDCGSGVEVDYILAVYERKYSPTKLADITFNDLDLSPISAISCGTYNFNIKMTPSITIEQGNSILIAFGPEVNVDNIKCEDLDSPNVDKTNKFCFGNAKQKYETNQPFELLVKDIIINPGIDSFTVIVFIHSDPMPTEDSQQQGKITSVPIPGTDPFEEVDSVQVTNSKSLVVGEPGEYQFSVTGHCTYSGSVTYTISFPDMFDLSDLGCEDIEGCYPNSKELIIFRSQYSAEPESFKVKLPTPIKLTKLTDPFTISIMASNGKVMFTFDKYLKQDFGVAPGLISDLAIAIDDDSQGAITTYTWTFTATNGIPFGSLLCLYLGEKAQVTEDYTVKMSLDGSTYDEVATAYFGVVLVITISSAISKGASAFIKIDNIMNPQEPGDFSGFYMQSFLEEELIIDQSGIVTVSVRPKMDCDYVYSSDYKMMRLTCSLLPLSYGDSYGSDSILILILPEKFQCDKLVESGPNLGIYPDVSFIFFVRGTVDSPLKFTYSCREPIAAVDGDIDLTFTKGSKDIQITSHVSYTASGSSDSAELTLDCDNNKPTMKTKCKLTINRGSSPPSIEVIQINAKGLKKKPEASRRLLEEAVCDIKPDSMPSGTSCSYGNEGETLTLIFDSPNTAETITFSNLEFVNPEASTKNNQKISVRTFSSQAMTALIDVHDDKLALDDIVCNYPCHTCSGDEDTCDTCVNDDESGTYNSIHETSPGVTECLQVDEEEACDTGYSAFNAICKQCTNGCSECTNQVDQCTACSAEEYLYDGNCEDNCPKGTFKEESPKACYKCTDNCNVCKDKTTCKTCDEGFFLYNGACQTSCHETTFAQGSECIDCSPSCKGCSVTATNCISCRGELLLSGSDCVPECPGGTTGIDSVCKQCEDPCSECKNKVDYCTTCKGGKYVYRGNCEDECPAGTATVEESKSCVGCMENCDVCGDESNCKKCKGNLYLYAGDCIASCDEGRFLKESECFDCDPNCKGCSESATNCISCEENLFLSKGMCVNKCPDNSITEGKVCNECNEPCSKCETTVDRCTDCIEGYFFYDSACRNQCPEGTSARTFGTDRTCATCGDHCEACEWYSESHELPTICTKCDKWHKRKESISDYGDYAIICEKNKKFPILLVIGGSMLVLMFILGLILNYREVAAACVIGLSTAMIVCYVYQLIYSANKEEVSVAITAAILLGLNYLLNVIATAYVYYNTCKTDKETSKSSLLITSIFSTLISFQFFRLLFAWDRSHSAKVKELRYVLNLLSIGHFVSAVVIIVANAIKLSDLPWNTTLSMILFETIVVIGCYVVALAIEVACCNSQRAITYRLPTGALTQ